MIVGFTGHRPNRMPIGPERVLARLEEALGSIARAERARDAAATLTALSALAEGSDRLFARAALRLGYRLEAVLPFPSAEYERTFADAAASEGFRGLLKAAARITELPGSLGDTKAAYEAAGHRIVESCDVLVAVWDGKPAAGRGGTPVIIEYALSRVRQVILVDAAVDRPPTRLAPDAT
jgi:hypothetical protein